MPRTVNDIRHPYYDRPKEKSAEEKALDRLHGERAGVEGLCGLLFVVVLIGMLTSGLIIGTGHNSNSNHHLTPLPTQVKELDSDMYWVPRSMPHPVATVCGDDIYSSIDPVYGGWQIECYHGQTWNVKPKPTYHAPWALWFGSSGAALLLIWGPGTGKRRRIGKKIERAELALKAPEIEKDLGIPQ